jgi:hypothetical protein
MTKQNKMVNLKKNRKYWQDYIQKVNDSPNQPPPHNLQRPTKPNLPSFPPSHISNLAQPMVAFLKSIDKILDKNCDSLYTAEEILAMFPNYPDNTDDGQAHKQQGDANIPRLERYKLWTNWFIN